MSHDIYTALSGAMASWRQLEVTANNMANTSTTGFKAARTTFEVPYRSDEPLANSQVRISGEPADMRDGAIQLDGVATHVALQGRGFLVAIDNGQEVLQRSGALRLDSNRRLVTQDGLPIMGEAGFITLPEDEGLVIDMDGTVRTTEGVELDRLRLVDAEVLEPRGAARWTAGSPIMPTNEVDVLQGALEGSNADPIREMLQLVEVSHEFEMFQKVMRTSDDLDGRMIQTGRK